MSKFTISNIAVFILALLFFFMGIAGFSYSWVVLVLGLMVYLCVLICGVVNVKWQFFMPIICEIPNLEKEIFLSFDDGPQEQSKAVLDLLKKHNMKANFFCIGKHLEENPEWAQRLFDEGHFVGNHSYLHGLKFPVKSLKNIIAELEKTNEIIERFGGRKSEYFRPPFGVSNPNIAKAVTSLNLKCIGWTIRSFDTSDAKGSKALQKIKGELKSGDIVLLHDHSFHVLSILEGLIPFLKENNYKTQRIDIALGVNEKAKSFI
ncbi:polysaccharide deacetylase family protein [Labilibaculum euxinus]